MNLEPDSNHFNFSPLWSTLGMTKDQHRLQVQFRQSEYHYNRHDMKCGMNRKVKKAKQREMALPVTGSQVVSI